MLDQFLWKSACRIRIGRFLKGFYHIWVCWPSWSCDQPHVVRFSFPLYLKSFIQNSVKISTVVYEKIKFECLKVQTLGPRSRDDIGLQYSHIFMYSIRCFLLLPFRSLAAIVSEKSTINTFFL